MRLSQFPFVVVRIGCRKCSRNGQYRLARLAAAYGPETSTELLLDRLTLDCIYRLESHGRSQRGKACGACLIDIDGAPRPPDFPPEMRAFTVVRGGKG